VFVLVGPSALVLLACGSDGGGGTTASTGTTVTTASTGASAKNGTNADCPDVTGEGASFTITIADFSYVAPCFTASASQGISIVNQDDIDHTVTMTGTQIDVAVAAGESFNGTPIAGAVEPGTYGFPCAIRPGMTGRVTVVASWPRQEPRG
jgi:plastocyanin